MAVSYSLVRFVLIVKKVETGEETLATGNNQVGNEFLRVSRKKLLFKSYLKS